MRDVVATGVWRTGFLLFFMVLMVMTGRALGGEEKLSVEAKAYRVEGTFTVAFNEVGGRRFSGGFTGLRGELEARESLQREPLAGGVVIKLDTWHGGQGRDEAALGEALIERFRFKRYLELDVQRLGGVRGDMVLGSSSQGRFSGTLRFEGATFPFEVDVTIKRTSDDQYVVNPVAAVEVPLNGIDSGGTISKAFEKGGWTLHPVALFTFRFKLLSQ